MLALMHMLGRKDQAAKMSQEETETIQLGETHSGGLRLWAARLAVEHTEKRLDVQSTSMDGMFTKATQILGWNVAMMAAFLALTQKGQVVSPLLAVLCVGSITVCLCIAVLWPRQFHAPGQSVKYLIHDQHFRTELQALEEMAYGNEDAIKANRTHLARKAFYLRLAWVSFALTPAAGIVTYLIALA